MSFSNLILLVVLSLLVINHVAAENCVEWVYNTEYKSNLKPVTIKPSSTQNQVCITKTHSYDNGKKCAQWCHTYEDHNAEKNFIQFDCQLFISFNEQDVGIYTCQNDDNEHILFSSAGIHLNQPPSYYTHTAKCEGLTDIFEGEETISCMVQQKSRQNITIGWIQSGYKSLQSYDLMEGKINLTFRALHPGDGIFFYCFLSKYQNNMILHLCYTLILKVHPQLVVKVKTLSKTPGKHCFICHAGGGSGKIYNWTLNGEKLTNINATHYNKRCFNKLPVGIYTIKCLVSTKVQETSDCMEFTVDYVTLTGTALQVSTPQESKLMAVIMVLAATTTILLFAGFILIYRQKKKHYNPQSKDHTQKGIEMSFSNASYIPQISTDEEMYYTIENNAEHRENHFAITNTVTECNTEFHNKEINEIIGGKERNEPDTTDVNENKKFRRQNDRSTDGEIPYYFVLESNLPEN